mmetsp:Transcript_15338/g.25320  ORF Transcript_15338/g.25320 Transcript_15338/m.25320 type:complete len:225 (-) Transcript_15338:933-1607(-)
MSYHGGWKNRRKSEMHCPANEFMLLQSNDADAREGTARIGCHAFCIGFACAGSRANGHGAVQQGIDGDAWGSILATDLNSRARAIHRVEEGCIGLKIEDKEAAKKVEVTTGRRRLFRYRKRRIQASELAPGYGNDIDDRGEGPFELYGLLIAHAVLCRLRSIDRYEVHHTRISLDLKAPCVIQESSRGRRELKELAQYRILSTELAIILSGTYAVLVSGTSHSN